METVCVSQKSLWDAIKHKNNKVAAPRRKVTDQPLKMASNKVFQVSRKPQYKREKARSPLASLNAGKPETGRPFIKLIPQMSPQQMASLENIYNVQRRSSLDPLGVPLCPDGMVNKPENKDLIQILNKTLSPIGTPERLKKLMPHIYHESPLSVALKPAASPEDDRSGAPVLSVKDALALIDSDLSHVNSSPRDTSSSCGFYDSLGSSGSHGCQADHLEALPDSPHQPDACEQRLTFFVTKPVVSEAAGPNPSKKAPFTSVTVTKVKAPAEAHSLSGRKIRKSKRRLLEKTLELSDGSSESGPGTPSLPVIGVDTGTKLCEDAPQPGVSPSTLGQQLQGLPSTMSSPLSLPPDHISFSLASPLPIDTSIPSSSPLSASSPLHSKMCLKSNTNKPSPAATTPPPVQEDLFPIHMALKSKKRKSEEFLKSDVKIEDVGKPAAVKRTRVVARRSEACRSVQERRMTSQRQQRTAGERV